MSQSPAYHLRTNKAVERLLFLELLRKLDRSLPRTISRCQYIGLGGPYLEDFAMIHATFGCNDMLSLELKEHVCKRQRINRPHSQVTVTRMSTGTFVEEYVPKSKPVIVWFDFEWPAWKQQLAESCDLLQRLPLFSLFKITLAGKTEWLGGGGGRDPLASRADKLSKMFGDYGPFAAKDLNEKSIATTLYFICRRAVGDAVPDTEARCVRSLASYEYTDGTPILTMTMVVGPSHALDELINNSELHSWRFADLGWSGPIKIAVPALSLREKLAVDQLLPHASGQTVLRKVKLSLSEDYKDSLELINNYVDFYRHVPQFVRMTT